MEFVKSLIDILLHLDVHLDLVIQSYVVSTETVEKPYF